MLKQIKKRFLCLLLCCFMLSKSAHATEIVSDVVYQKSIIEEQQIFCNVGVATILEADYVTLGADIKNNYGLLILTLTDEEKELILKTTFAEAGNQCIEGQRAVIEVILNRVMSEDFPNTVEGVLSAPKQFSVWKYLHKVSYGEKQLEAFSLVYEEEPILPNNNYVYFSRGKSNGKNYIKIEDHWFSEKK